MTATNDKGVTACDGHPSNTNTNDDATVARLAKTRHPLSAAFGDMPADEFAELVRDIKKSGLLSAIVAAEDGSILDGWHRYRACIEAGIKPRIEPFSFVIECAAEDVGGRKMTEAEFVVAQNAHRRHLTAEQRRKIVAELLKAEPAKSDRAIGSMAKVDGKTVGVVRATLEATAEIPQLTKTTGKDGRARPTKAKTVSVRLDRQPATPKTVQLQVTRAAERQFVVDAAPLAVPAELVSTLPEVMALPATAADAEAAHILAQIAALNDAELTDAAGFASALVSAAGRIGAPRGAMQ